MRCLLAILSLLLCGANWHSCAVKRCIDGDTIVADVQLDFGVVLANQRLRLAGYDAWELREQGGKEAKRALERLLEHGCEVSPWSEKNNSRDDFGRLLVRCRAGDVDVAEWMRERGFHKKGL